MREIKFRGKRVDNGEWVYGYYFCGYQKYSYIESEEYKHWIEGYDEKGHYFVYEVIPETVGQFTGLKDKNGKRIYEGDVVRVTNNSIEISDGKNTFYETRIYEIFFHKHSFMGDLKKYGLPFLQKTIYPIYHYLNEMSDDIEVIGNIHDKGEVK